MNKVTKEDVSKAAREYIEAKTKLDTMIEKSPIVPKREIGLAIEETEKLHRKWYELINAYVSQRETQ